MFYAEFQQEISWGLEEFLKVFWGVSIFFILVKNRYFCEGFLRNFNKKFPGVW